MTTQELQSFFEQVGKWQAKPARPTPPPAAQVSFFDLLETVLPQGPSNSNAYSGFANLSPGPALGAPVNTA